MARQEEFFIFAPCGAKKTEGSYLLKPSILFAPQGASVFKELFLFSQSTNRIKSCQLNFI